MHDAPSVTYPVGRSRLLALALGGISTLGLSGLFAASVQGQDPVRLVGGGAAWLLAVGVWVWRWRCLPEGLLHWDGSNWFWAEPASDEPGVIRCVLDGQRFMLLQWGSIHHQAATSAPVWIWAEFRRGQATEWRAMRRAVYSRARSRIAP